MSERPPFFVKVKSAPAGLEGIIKMFEILGALISAAGALRGHLLNYRANWDDAEKPYLGLEFSVDGELLHRTFCLLIPMDRVLIAERPHPPDSGSES